MSFYSRGACGSTASSLFILKTKEGKMWLFVEIRVNTIKGSLTMEKDWNYYGIIRNSIQLTTGQLYSFECTRNDQGESSNLNLRLEERLVVIDDKNIDIFLRVVLSFKEEGPFTMSVVHKGQCLLLDENINLETFEKYTKDQIAPLLLPYAREYIASTLSRMQLPIYTIPTIDVLQSIINNDQQEG
jgi:preprotein translocase subunit SecB